MHDLTSDELRPSSGLFLSLLVALLATSCKSKNFQEECVCGTDLTPSELSCSSRDLCEGNFDLVGHNDLGARGSNSALAIAGDYAYVGSRVGNALEDAEGVTRGIKILNIADPANPEVVGELGAPDASGFGLSTRELRALPSKNLLIVLHMWCRTWDTCSTDRSLFPNTGGISETEKLKLFDISDPVNPTLVGAYDFGTHPEAVTTVGPPPSPHEFYLWQDPNVPERAIIYVSRLSGPPAVEAIDITDPTNPVQLATWDPWNDADLEDELSPDGPAPVRDIAWIHSLTASADGTRLYVAHWGAGFYIVDASTIADNTANELRTLTPMKARIDYSPPYQPWTHSAVEIPGRNLAYVSDETLSNFGCPWGWGRMVDISDPANPKLFEKVDVDEGTVVIEGQLQIAQNDPDLCPSELLVRDRTYTTHNPTVTENLVLTSYYAGGMQVFDIENARHPVQVGAFFPEPLANVTREDRPNSGAPVAMWGFPIIKDGLIYVTDLRNGLYILRYTGPKAVEVSSRTFLDGASNLSSY